MVKKKIAWMKHKIEMDELKLNEKIRWKLDVELIELVVLPTLL